jgi:hypothetical protein
MVLWKSSGSLKDYLCVQDNAPCQLLALEQITKEGGAGDDTSEDFVEKGQDSRTFVKSCAKGVGVLT